MSERKRYIVNWYGPDDQFLKKTTPARKPKIGLLHLHNGVWLTVWYIEEIERDRVFNVRLEVQGA